MSRRDLDARPGRRAGDVGAPIATVIEDRSLQLDLRSFRGIKNGAVVLPHGGQNHAAKRPWGGFGDERSVIAGKAASQIVEGAVPWPTMRSH